MRLHYKSKLIRMKKNLSIIFLCLLFTIKQTYSQPNFLKIDTVWVNQVFDSLTLDERIGQLFMVDAYSSHDCEHQEKIEELISKYKIGGLIFFQAYPVTQAQMTNYYQSLSKVPLLVGFDGEWGLGMRLDSTTKFPYQMTLGAIQNDSLIYEMGAEIAHQFKRIGMHINFAPVVDVNNNPANPVINYRSFGEDKTNVAKKGIAYLKGLQDNGVMACAKHFPGHGDTDTDSHLALPVLKQNRERLDTLELFPFRECVKAGVASVMVAHLNVPALDSTKHLPSSLSHPIISHLLKEQMAFKGLIFTDALNMKGVTKHFTPGQTDVKALLAGNDVLLMSEDVPKAISEIKKAIAKGQLKIEDINERCKKILMAKKWVGLDKYKPVEIKNLVADLNSVHANLVHRKLTEASLTVLRNHLDVIPVREDESIKIASISFGSDSMNIFQKTLSRYANVNHIFVPKVSKDSLMKVVYKTIKNYDLIIISIQKLNSKIKNNFGVTDSLANALDSIVSMKKTIVVVFGNPYSLSKMSGLRLADGLVEAYQDNPNSQELAADLIFGAVAAHGRLPVAANYKFKLHDGIDTPDNWRFKYTIAEEVGIDYKKLEHRIDSVANWGIAQKAYPGCQILVAKNGKLIFHKTYGFFEYEKINKVEKNDLYDLASITKIAASLPALMKLFDASKIKLDEPISNYYTDLKKSNKKNITFRDALTHFAQLQAWIPFWKSAVKKDGTFKRKTFAHQYSSGYPYKIADSLYMHKKFAKEVYKQIIKSDLLPKKEYKYSDLSFYWYPLIIEKITHQKFEQYLSENIYKPLGAKNFTFNAWKKYPMSQIVPAEVDTFFRKQIIRGHVDDEGAALLDGISGHAGLFGTAEDLAKLMQMYLQKGFFAGTQFIKPETIEEFTRCQFCEQGNRRGIGFDKPYINNNLKPLKDAYPASSASAESFGHSGFTGTFAWVDPKNGLLYIFLSNRTYPSRTNNKLSDLNIRPTIHQIIYDAINEGVK